eukprot:SAG22_NODE_1969_length_3234_cov_2.212759_4_plen_110_part_00
MPAGPAQSRPSVSSDAVLKKTKDNAPVDEYGCTGTMGSTAPVVWNGLRGHDVRRRQQLCGPELSRRVLGEVEHFEEVQFRRKDTICILQWQQNKRTTMDGKMISDRGGG